jgi:hypothetical protein
VSFKTTGILFCTPQNMEFEHNVWCDGCLCVHARHNCAGWEWRGNQQEGLDFHGPFILPKHASQEFLKLTLGCTRYSSLRYSWTTTTWFGWAHVKP